MAINGRRGFNRLYVVLSLGFYVWKGFWTYIDWGNRVSQRLYNFEECRDANLSNCAGAWPPLQQDWIATTILVLLAPPFLYGFGWGAWLVLRWIARGFIGRVPVNSVSDPSGSQQPSSSPQNHQ